MLVTRISLTEETAYGPGWVRISVRPPLEQPVAGVVISRRQSDKPHLGTKGWQSQRHCLVPDKTIEGESDTTLLFGPNVTSHLMVDMDVDVTVEGAGIQERHFWPDILAAQPNAIGRIAGIDAPPITLPGGSGVPNAPVDDPNNTGSTAHPGEDKDQTIHVESDLPHQASRWPLYTALTVLALVLAGVAAYFLIDRDAPAIPAPATVPLAAVPSAPQETETPGFAQRYETYRDAGNHADELFTLFQEARDAGDEQVAERAIVLAETRGSGAAMLQLGKWKDPGQPTGRFSDPQPAAAARYYRRAAEAGQVEAQTLLSQLCARAVSPSEGEIQLFQNFPSNEYCR